ncbi:uncharacterized protein LOC115217408 isoform X2 [Octopus sinensis]|uniref:Uncharacterized protein LOC115217408 isoform X2 n=1 Tax=Octopus sinensis TaxID=2607531 RepID=A0A7E6F6M6_9MOLL|nr:uncharacterized protein LOC115217408 isoform X2 [Octopus sinensis]
MVSTQRITNMERWIFHYHRHIRCVFHTKEIPILGYNKTSQQLTRKNNTKSKFTTQQKEEKNEPFKGAINDVKIL